MGSRPHVRARRCPARQPAVQRGIWARSRMHRPRCRCADGAWRFARRAQPWHFARHPGPRSQRCRGGGRLALSKPKLDRILLSAVRDTARWRPGIDATASRHTAATWLDHAGVTPNVASELMGHKTPEYQAGATITLRATPTPSPASSNGRATSSTPFSWIERRKGSRSDNRRFFPSGFPPVTALRSTSGISGRKPRS